MALKELYWTKGEDFDKVPVNVAIALHEAMKIRGNWTTKVDQMLAYLKLPKEYHFPEPQTREASLANFKKYKEVIVGDYWPLIGPLADGKSGVIAYLCSKNEDNRDLL